jgi:hypothetical protein
MRYYTTEEPIEKSVSNLISLESCSAITFGLLQIVSNEIR